MQRQTKKSRGGSRAGAGRAALWDFIKGGDGWRRCQWVISAVRIETDRTKARLEDEAQSRNAYRPLYQDADGRWRRQEQSNYDDLRRWQAAMRATPIADRQKGLVLNIPDPDPEDVDPQARKYVRRGAVEKKLGKLFIDHKVPVDEREPEQTLERIIGVKLAPRQIGIIYDSVLSRARTALESLDGDGFALKIAQECRHIQVAFTVSEGELQARYDLETDDGVTKWAMDARKFAWRVVVSEPRASSIADPLGFLRGLTIRQIKRCIAEWKQLEEQLERDLADYKAEPDGPV